MRHEKLDGIKTPFEKILSAVSSVHDVAASSLTTPTGSVSFDNSDGTRTIIGAQIGNNNIATHVGDTTPPPKPIFSAKCKGGVLSVQWDGKLEGEIPPDFYCVTFCTDTRVLGALKSPGTVTTTIGDAKNNEYITVYGYSEDDACGADGSAKHNKSEKVSVKVQVVDDFEKIKEDITAFKKDADVKYAHKVEVDDATKKLTEQYNAVYESNKDLDKKYEEVATIKNEAAELSRKIESNYYTSDTVDNMINEQNDRNDSRISTIKEQLTDKIHDITNEKESEIKQYVDRIITKIQDNDNALNVYEDSSKMVIYGNGTEALVLYNNGQLALCTIQIFDDKPVITSTKVSLGSNGIVIHNNNNNDDFIIKNTIIKNFYKIVFSKVENFEKQCNTIRSKDIAFYGSNTTNIGSNKNIIMALDPPQQGRDDCFINIARKTFKEALINYDINDENKTCGCIDLYCSQHDNSKPDYNFGSWLYITPYSMSITSNDLYINGQTISDTRKTIYLYGSWASQRYMMLKISLNIAELYFNCDCEEWKWLYSDIEIPQEYRPNSDINDVAMIYKGSYPADIWIPGQGNAEGRPSLFCRVSGNVVGHSTWAIAGRQH